MRPKSRREPAGTQAKTYDHLTRELGVPFYERIDAPATAEQKVWLKAVYAEQIGMKELAGEPVCAKRTTARVRAGVFGGIKVTAENGWFAARPSGTEDVYKIYAESFRSRRSLAADPEAAQDAIAACSRRQSLHEVSRPVGWVSLYSQMPVCQKGGGGLS